MVRKAKIKHIGNTELILRRCKKYRNNDIDKEKERHRLQYFNNKEIVNEKKRKYNYLDY